MLIEIAWLVLLALASSRIVGKGLEAMGDKKRQQSWSLIAILGPYFVHMALRRAVTSSPGATPTDGYQVGLVAGTILFIIISGIQWGMLRRLKAKVGSRSTTQR